MKPRALRSGARFLVMLLAAASAPAGPCWATSGLPPTVAPEVSAAWERGDKRAVAEHLTDHLARDPEALRVRLARGEALLDVLEVDAAIEDFRIVYASAGGDLRTRAAELLLEGLLFERRFEPARELADELGAQELSASLTRQIAEHRKLADRMRFTRRGLWVAIVGWLVLLFGGGALISRQRPPV